MFKHGDAMSDLGFFNKLFELASGLTPNETLHRTVLDIEPVTGMVLSAHKRIQVRS